MESLDSIEKKYRYDILGHSGDSDKLEFVKLSSPPKNEMERFRGERLYICTKCNIEVLNGTLSVLESMVAHAQFCWSGDCTLEAAKRSIEEIAAEHDDEIGIVAFNF